LNDVGTINFFHVCKQGYRATLQASISKECIIQVAGFGFVNDVDLLEANDTINQTQEQVMESLQGCLNSSWELG